MVEILMSEERTGCTEEELRAVLGPFLTSAPAWRYEPQFDPTAREFSGIRALSYDCAEYEGKTTRVFAYLGFPKHSHGERVPGIVLVHGGTGHAYLPWVKMWNERGYAAIAMDNTGFYPSHRDCGKAEMRDPDGFLRDPALLATEGYINGPDNDGVSRYEKPVKAQWMTHALCQTAAANSLLRSFDVVDEDRVGITGISWGGIITSLAIGYDDRYAFAIPVYGSGYLGVCYGYLKNSFGNPNISDCFLAEKRFEKVKMPVLWLCWNRDVHFSINSNTLSYFDTEKNNEKTALSIVDEMGHSHCAGWTPEISQLYADSVVFGRGGTVTFLSQPTETVASAKLSVPSGVKLCGARLFSIGERMRYEKRDQQIPEPAYEWQKTEARIDGNTVSAAIPDGCAGYYIEVSFESGGLHGVSCSGYVEPDQK